MRAGLYDPGGVDYTRPVQCADAAFRLTQGVGPRHDIDFGAQSHGPHTRCLRFAGRVAPPPRKTRFRLPASFAGRDWLPAGLLLRRFQPCLFTRHPPSPGFSWRTGHSVLLLQQGVNTHHGDTEAQRTSRSSSPAVLRRSRAVPAVCGPPGTTAFTPSHERAICCDVWPLLTQTSIPHAQRSSAALLTPEFPPRAVRGPRGADKLSAVGGRRGEQQEPYLRPAVRRAEGLRASVVGVCPWGRTE